MEPSNKFTKLSYYFIASGLICLFLALLFGVMSAAQYVSPGFLKDIVSFERLRPAHVSSIIFWLLLTLNGLIFYFLHNYLGPASFKINWLRIQFGSLCLAYVLIITSYLFGVFGGREYWEFPPIISLLIVFSWIIFLFRFLYSVRQVHQMPVFVWMWLTGIVFFLFTLIESYLWLIPYVSHHIVKDITIQWKANGSMVGSWNMMMYGCGIYVMDKIKQNHDYSKSKMAYVLYFIGLTNMFFNWGHHIYTTPTLPIVKGISYAISMTELFIFGRIIFYWRKSLEEHLNKIHLVSIRFMFYSDIWIFLNLLLAILISIPAINVFSHGTFITVAHSMGATIGINSMILFSCISFILNMNAKEVQFPIWAVKMVNWSLGVFWSTLLITGVNKAIWQVSSSKDHFMAMMHRNHNWHILMLLSGLLLAIFLIALIIVFLKRINKLIRN